VEGDLAIVGITDYASRQLGDIVFVELPEIGRSLAQSDAVGVIESVKAVSDLFAPISGEVVEANAELTTSPSSSTAIRSARLDASNSHRGREPARRVARSSRL